MIILHVITGLNRGGAELMLQRLIRHHRHQPELRHHVVSLTAVGPIGSALAAEGVPVSALGMRGPLHLPSAVRRLTNEIRRLQPDVVQCWMYHADLAGGIAARRAGCRNILWGVRVADIFPAMGVPRTTLIVRRLCALLSRRIPSRILYVAESARLVHERLGYDSSKSLVIHNGYEFLSREQAEAFRVARRQELGLSDDAILIGSAGRFSPQKGFFGFVEAAAAVAAHRPDAQFLLVGREVEWTNEALAQRVRDSGLAARFHLLGERSDLAEWLSAMDLFVLNSLGEGFPNVVAEAMSVGVPCLVTDVGDSALLVGETGTVIKPRDQVALTRAMQAMALEPLASRRALGERARLRVEQNFSMPVIARRFEQLYKGLVQASARPARVVEM